MVTQKKGVAFIDPFFWVNWMSQIWISLFQPDVKSLLAPGWFLPLRRPQFKLMLLKTIRLYTVKYLYSIKRFCWQQPSAKYTVRPCAGWAWGLCTVHCTLYSTYKYTVLFWMAKSQKGLLHRNLIDKKKGSINRPKKKGSVKHILDGQAQKGVTAQKSYWPKKKGSIWWPKKKGSIKTTPFFWVF